jgi:hypothetical protein
MCGVLGVNVTSDSQKICVALLLAVADLWHERRTDASRVVGA